MNKAFKRKVKRWYSSKYYMAWAGNPSRKYSEWIQSQSNKVKRLIYGATGGATVNHNDGFSLNRVNGCIYD